MNIESEISPEFRLSISLNQRQVMGFGALLLLCAKDN
jgi:hypothetical protein